MTRRLLTDLTSRQQEFLLRAYWEGVTLDDPIATPARTNRLELAGLIHKRTSKKGRTSWRLTDVGRGMVAAHVPRLLAPVARPVRGERDSPEELGYTHLPHKALPQEPEAA